MEPCRAVDAHNGNVEAQNKAPEGLYTSAADSHHIYKDPDPH
jgi:hypothetical protein